jgi:hypothetical protein
VGAIIIEEPTQATTIPGFLFTQADKPFFQKGTRDANFTRKSPDDRDLLIEKNVDGDLGVTPSTLHRRVCTLTAGLLLAGRLARMRPPGQNRNHGIAFA